jgi:hypothetical protein
MKNTTDLRKILLSTTFVERVVSVADGMAVSADLRKRLVTYAQRRRAGLLAVEGMIGPIDSVDFYRALALLWLELRFEWQRNDLVANYNAFRSTHSDPAAPLFAAASSRVLEIIEEHLDDADRERMADFAAELAAGTHQAFVTKGLSRNGHHAS